MEGMSNAQGTCRPEVVDAIVRHAEQDRSRDLALAPDFLIWRATDEVKRTHPNVSRAEQEAAFDRIMGNSSSLQRAYYASLELQTAQILAQFSGE